MGKQAKLPRGRGIKLIKDMVVGETCWASPGCVEVDQERNLWLSAFAKAYESPARTYTVRVARRDDGYHVRPPADEMWSVMRGDALKNPQQALFGQPCYVPVAELHN
jgi:hypothetical protein